MKHRYNRSSKQTSLVFNENVENSIESDETLECASWSTFLACKLNKSDENSCFLFQNTFVMWVIDEIFVERELSTSYLAIHQKNTLLHFSLPINKQCVFCVWLFKKPKYCYRIKNWVRLLRKHYNCFMFLCRIVYIGNVLWIVNCVCKCKLCAKYWVSTRIEQFTDWTSESFEQSCAFESKKKHKLEKPHRHNVSMHLKWINWWKGLWFHWLTVPKMIKLMQALNKIVHLDPVNRH